MFEIGKTCVGSQIEKDNYKIKICLANVMSTLFIIKFSHKKFIREQFVGYVFFL